jgi:hypothetical protein
MLMGSIVALLMIFAPLNIWARDFNVEKLNSLESAKIGGYPDDGQGSFSKRVAVDTSAAVEGGSKYLAAGKI